MFKGWSSFPSIQKRLRSPFYKVNYRKPHWLLAGTKKYSLSVPSGGEVVLDHGIFLTGRREPDWECSRFAKSGLSIEAVLENGQLLLKISDDGPGYPPELIENGPKPFETASSNSSHFWNGPLQQPAFM